MNTQEKCIVRPRFYVWVFGVIINAIFIGILYKNLVEYIATKEDFSEMLVFTALFALVIVIPYNSFLYGKVVLSKEGIKLRSIMIPLLCNFKVKKTTLILSWKDCESFDEMASVKGATRYRLKYTTTIGKGLPLKFIMQILPFFHVNVYKAIGLIEEYLPADRFDEYLLNELREKGKI